MHFPCRLKTKLITLENLVASMESKMADGSGDQQGISRDIDTDFDDRRSLLSEKFDGAMNPKLSASAPVNMNVRGGSGNAMSMHRGPGFYPPAFAPIHDDTYSALYQNSAPTPQAQTLPSSSSRAMFDSQPRGRSVFASPAATVTSPRSVQSASSANANSMWYPMDDAVANRPSHANLLQRSMSAGRQRPAASKGQQTAADAARRRQVMGFTGGKIDRWCIVLGPLTKVRGLERYLIADIYIAFLYMQFLCFIVGV